MPATLELAGIPRPEHVQFKSLLPLVANPDAVLYDAIYGGYIDLQRMVFDGRFKLIYYPKIEKYLLFDLQNDAAEMQDLAEVPGYAPKMVELQKKLQNLQIETGDTLKLQIAALDSAK